MFIYCFSFSSHTTSEHMYRYRLIDKWREEWREVFAALRLQSLSKSSVRPSVTSFAAAAASAEDYSGWLYGARGTERRRSIEQGLDAMSARVS